VLDNLRDLPITFDGSDDFCCQSNQCSAAYALQLNSLN